MIKTSYNLNKKIGGSKMDYASKIQAIQKAISKGQIFICADKMIRSINQSYAITGKDWFQRTWSICSTHVDKWFNEIA